MNNFIQEGEVLTLTAPYTVSSGAGAQVGSIFGVATGAIASGVEGEFATCGVYSLAKTSAQAWAVGDKIYWDNSNKRCDTDGTVGMLIGVATAIAANPSSTGYVKLNEAVPSSAEGPQAAIASLTDNSGGAVADGTIGAVTAPTTLTDNGGGTADGTIASQAAPTTLTDSTGLSGTHDNTIADGQVADGTMGGTADGAFETVGATNGGDVSAAIMNNFKEVQAKLTVLTQNDSDLAGKTIEMLTLATVAQNNLKEMTTRQGENRVAIVALTDAVKELSTKVNDILATLRLAGVIST